MTKSSILFILTFFGGGGGFLNCPLLTSSVSFCSFVDFFWSISDKTTKKWWHFSHLTNLVDAACQKDSRLSILILRLVVRHEFENLQTKVSTLVQGLPHFGQQKWLSFPPLEEELPALLPFPMEVVSTGGFVPVLQSQKLVENSCRCCPLTEYTPLDTPEMHKTSIQEKT